MANSNSSFSIKIEGLDKLLDNFHAAGVNYQPIFSQAMRNATQKIQNEARNNIRIHGTTFQGNLARSITVREATAYRGQVATSEGYSGAVEFGRRPGKFPPVAPLERWAAIKLGKPGLGFVVARKIKEKGTKEQPYMEPAFRDNINYVLDQFKMAADILVHKMAE